MLKSPMAPMPCLAYLAVWHLLPSLVVSWWPFYAIPALLFFWFQGGGLVLVLSTLDTETAIKRASDSVLEEFHDATQVMLEFKCAQGGLRSELTGNSARRYLPRRLPTGGSRA